MAVKSETTAKKPRGAGKPFTKGDKRINLNGAPKRGASMAEAYEWAMSLRPEEVVGILTLNGSNDLARQYKQMPQGVQLKLLVALRIVASVMFEPSPGLINHMTDRTDGPVTEKIENSGKVEIVVTYADRNNTPDITPSAEDDQVEGAAL
jgi:hypothetical protein